MGSACSGSRSMHIALRILHPGMRPPSHGSYMISYCAAMMSNGTGFRWP